MSFLYCFGQERSEYFVPDSHCLSCLFLCLTLNSKSYPEKHKPGESLLSFPAGMCFCERQCDRVCDPWFLQAQLECGWSLAAGQRGCWCFNLTASEGNLPGATMCHGPPRAVLGHLSQGVCRLSILWCPC